MFCSAEILVDTRVTIEPKKASHHSLQFASLLVCLLCQYYGRLGVCAALWTNQMEYIIVIARGQGLVAVNQPESKGKAIIITLVRWPWWDCGVSSSS